MSTILRSGLALCLVAWLFLPAIVAGTGDDGREAPRGGELNRPASTDGGSDRPTLVESGIDSVVESLGERRDVQPRFDDDASVDAMKRRHRRKNRRDDERSDERDDEFPEPDEDEDGDMTPSGP